MSVFSITSFRIEKIKKLYIRKVAEMTAIDRHRTKNGNQYIVVVQKVREKTIEKKLRLAVKNCGGICPKFVSPSMNGMPDRLILLPSGKIAFAEIKAPGKDSRRLQLTRHGALKKLGFKVFVIDSCDQIKGVIDEIQSS